MEELEVTDLKDVNGGNPILAYIGIIALAVNWKRLCDEVHNIGYEIGEALAKQE
jgi:hypothetical protein